MSISFVTSHETIDAQNDERSGNSSNGPRAQDAQKNHIPHLATETSKNDVVVSKNQIQTTDGNKKNQTTKKKKNRNKIHVQSMWFLYPTKK
jgi:hypothetical protein